jgi:NAD(P)-dependent dehydrogenase (short-subunit alcohol dehydrogenase family)
VTDLASLDALYATITDRSGRLDVVVANAGSGRPSAWPASPKSTRHHLRRQRQGF